MSNFREESPDSVWGQKEIDEEGSKNEQPDAPEECGTIKRDIQRRTIEMMKGIQGSNRLTSNVLPF